MASTSALATDASTHTHNEASSSSSASSNHHPPSPSAAASAAADRVYHEFTHYATDHPATSSSASSASVVNAAAGLQHPSHSSTTVDAAAAVAAAAAAAAVAASNATGTSSASTPSGSMFPPPFAPDPNQASTSASALNPDSSVISLHPNANDQSMPNHSANETDTYDPNQRQDSTSLSQNQRSDQKDRNGNASSGSAVKLASRAQRACVNCRKQKMRCVGADDSRPCNRCSTHGLECVFEKATKEVAATQQRELTEGVFERLGHVERELAETKGLLLAIAVHLGVQAPALNPATSSSGPSVSSVGPIPPGTLDNSAGHHFFDDQAALTAAAVAAAVSGTDSPLSNTTQHQQQTTSAPTASGRKRGGAAAMSLTDSNDFADADDDQDSSELSSSRPGPDASWLPSPASSSQKRARLG